MIEKLLTIQQTAELLNVSPQTIYNLNKRGQLPFIQIGRLHRVSRTALEDLIHPAPATATPAAAEPPATPETPETVNPAAAAKSGSNGNPAVIEVMNPIYSNGICPLI